MPLKIDHFFLRVYTDERWRSATVAIGETSAKSRNQTFTRERRQTVRERARNFILVYIGRSNWSIDKIRICVRRKSRLTGFLVLKTESFNTRSTTHIKKAKNKTWTKHRNHNVCQSLFIPNFPVNSKSETEKRELTKTAQFICRVSCAVERSN